MEGFCDFFQGLIQANSQVLGLVIQASWKCALSRIRGKCPCLTLFTKTKEKDKMLSQLFD